MTGSTRVANHRHGARPLVPPLVTTHRSHGTYSEASDFSPQPFRANQDDDYTSIVTRASTHTAQRAPVNVDSTEWVNHVSHRRVTEIADRFAK
jgi:hypothetical protein